MTTLCPNCSRPARKDAQFCGYCGTNLKFPGITAKASQNFTGIEGNKAKSKYQKQYKVKKRDVGRTLAIISIILLFLIISGALLAQNWVDVLSFVLSSIFRLIAR